MLGSIRMLSLPLSTPDCEPEGDNYWMNDCDCMKEAIVSVTHFLPTTTGSG